MLLTQADAFKKGPALQNSKGILGEGLLTAEGDVHRQQRRLMQPAFHAKHVENYAADVSGEYAGGGGGVAGARAGEMRNAECGMRKWGGGGGSGTMRAGGSARDDGVDAGDRRQDAVWDVAGR